MCGDDISSRAQSLADSKFVSFKSTFMASQQAKGDSHMNNESAVVDSSQLNEMKMDFAQKETEYQQEISALKEITFILIE